MTDSSCCYRTASSNCNCAKMELRRCFINALSKKFEHGETIIRAIRNDVLESFLKACALGGDPQERMFAYAEHMSYDITFYLTLSDDTPYKQLRQLGISASHATEILSWLNDVVEKRPDPESLAKVLAHVLTI